jgi:hypothetical protein
MPQRMEDSRSLDTGTRWHRGQRGSRLRGEGGSNVHAVDGLPARSHDQDLDVSTDLSTAEGTMVRRPARSHTVVQVPRPPKKPAMARYPSTMATACWPHPIRPRPRSQPRQRPRAMRLRRIVYIKCTYPYGMRGPPTAHQNAPASPRSDGVKRIEPVTRAGGPGISADHGAGIHACPTRREE